MKIRSKYRWSYRKFYIQWILIRWWRKHVCCPEGLFWDAYSRTEDPCPAICVHCGWAGRWKDLVHGYKPDFTNRDVEPIDNCPDCGSENIKSARITYL